MHRELEDLIARHFDGHLDVAGQRQLAEMLAASAEARQTFARYLRLEGAAIKLASVSQLGLPSPEESPTTAAQQVAPEVELPSTASSSTSSRSRWVRAAWLAAAASLLVAVLLSQWMVRPPQVSHVANSAAVEEMNRLTENWLQLQEEAVIDEPDPADSTTPDASLAAVDSESETELVQPELDADSTPPPSWMIAAMADLVSEQSNPDEE